MNTEIEAMGICRPMFVFDLDSTITKCELLPLIAERTGMGSEMARLTERAMMEGISFEMDFPARVALLKDVPVSVAREIAGEAPLNAHIADFIRENHRRCLIMTGNLDVWIEEILEKMHMRGRCLCSQARVQDGHVTGVVDILNKTRASAGLAHPFVAVGDGSNDIGLLKEADLGIAFGGVRCPAEAVRAAADVVIWEEEALVGCLRKML